MLRNCGIYANLFSCMFCPKWFPKTKVESLDSPIHWLIHWLYNVLITYYVPYFFLGIHKWMNYHSYICNLTIFVNSKLWSFSGLTGMGPLQPKGSYLGFKPLELRMVISFLNNWKTPKQEYYFIIRGSNIKFKFQCHK